jgi:hypothetical protein
LYKVRSTPFSAYAAVAAFSLAFGAAIALDADAVLVAFVSLAVLGMALCVPRWATPSLYIGGLVALSIMQALPRTQHIAASIGGPARFTLVFTCLVVCQSIVRRARSRLSGGLTLALLGGIAVVAFQVIVGVARGTNFGAGLAQLYSDAPPIHDLSEALRSAMYPFAILLGALGIAKEDARAQKLHCYALLVAALLCSLLAGFDWLWLHGGPTLPGLSGLFASAGRVTQYQARAVFPFASDSPNGNSIALGCITIMASVLLFSLRNTSPRGAGLKRMGAILAAAGLVGVLATESRTGLICFVTGMFFSLSLLARWSLSRMAITAVGLAVCVFVSASLVLPSNRSLSTNAPTLIARTVLWSRAWDAIKANPVFGRGYNFSNSVTFGAPPIAGSRPAFATEQLPPEINGAQSQYLAELADGGLVGFALFLSPFFVVGIPLARRFRDARVGAALFAGVFVNMAIAAVTTTLASSPEVWGLMWLTLGSSAAYGLSRRPSDLRPPESGAQT